MSENGSEPLRFEPPEEENARLHRVLTAHGIVLPPPPPPPNSLPVQTGPPAATVDREERARKRVALFRSLFRGREDVYARRWENADGRVGYVPVALKDWKAINRSRPEDRKKVDEKTRRFLPLTDAVIEQHLLGKETIGVYALLSDETCWFLAADFDKKTWEYDSQAFLETCREFERSVPRRQGTAGKADKAVADSSPRRPPPGRHRLKREKAMFPDRYRRARAGFSLIELLIVIAIILIILAVALPKLTKARTFAQEMAAVKAISTIHTEEAQYYSQYGQYATSLTQLGPPTSGSPSANGADLIDKELATGEKGNFKFTLQPSPTGYVVTAVPTAFGTSGVHTYYSDQSMGIHQHSGQETATVNDPLVGEKEQTQQQQGK